MNTLRQRCPACDSQLELPAESAGKLGQCPACNATFTIGESDPVEAPVAESPPEKHVPASEPVDKPAPASTPSPTPAPSVGEDPQVFAPPVADVQSSDDGPVAEGDSDNPFATPLSSGVAVPDAALVAPGQQHPVQPNGAPPATSITMADCAIDEVLRSTWQIFAARWPTMVVTLVIVMALMFGVVFVPGMIISEADNAGADTLVAIMLFVWLPSLLAIFSLLAVGISRVYLSIARDDRVSPLSELVPPISLAVRFAVALLLIGGVIGGGSLAIFLSIAAIGEISGNPQLAGVFTALAAIVVAIIGMVCQWILWPWVPLICDGRASIFKSTQLSIRIALRNRTTSAIMVLVAVGLMAAGSIFCGVGVIVTLPIVLMMFTVAYLRMTGQPIGEIMAEEEEYEPLPERKPEF